MSTSSAFCFSTSSAPSQPMLVAVFKQIYRRRCQCTTCVNFVACKKCYGRIGKYHKMDNEPTHTFEIDSSSVEFQDPPTPFAEAHDNGLGGSLEAVAALDEIDLDDEI
ncbi:hypothetical protein QBC33DRAFT_519887 [Phialemonium atrogriseum]|uniref:Uncharacterized protein n=1 Tax=Phialemonium atrogriseum TaxID=1093897 RepID=A0AAJ0BRD4_9PEZI|nr:uncharacterized protein QBC33DRAFT_519887 [Phialemonium atrogriseum]KAK1762003.1 hypothetical protein QBC33DRAFT_519887 [Phialemonium atrogriseum]